MTLTYLLRHILYYLWTSTFAAQCGQRCLSGWSQAKLSGVAQDESWEDEDASLRRVPMGFGTLAVEEGRLDVAMNLTLQYDGYMRPSECLSLHSSQICPPAGKRYPHWAIVIAPSELDETTKTGTSDDSILVGDLSHN